MSDRDKHDELSRSVAEVAHDACQRSPRSPLPDPLRRELSRIAADDDLLASFRAELARLFRKRPMLAAFVDAPDDEVLDRWFSEAIRDAATVDRWIRSLGGDPARLRADVAQAREATLLGSADTLLLRRGAVATLSLDGIPASLAPAPRVAARCLTSAIGRAFRALLLPDMIPDGAALASDAVRVMAIDPKTRSLAPLADASPKNVDSLVLDQVAGRPGRFVLRGEPAVSVTARSLPEGTFPGGALMVVCPFRSGLRLSVAGELILDDPDDGDKVRLRASIEESFSAPPTNHPRLDRSGLTLVLVPQEISGPWLES